MTTRLTAEAPSAIVVSHSGPLLKRMCRAAVLIEDGEAVWFDDVEEALREHRRNLQLVSA